ALWAPARVLEEIPALSNLFPAVVALWGNPRCGEIKLVVWRGDLDDRSHCRHANPRQKCGSGETSEGRHAGLSTEDRDREDSERRRLHLALQNRRGEREAFFDGVPEIRAEGRKGDFEHRTNQPAGLPRLRFEDGYSQGAGGPWHQHSDDITRRDDG